MDTAMQPCAGCRAEETEGVTVVASGGYVTGSVAAFKCTDQREPDSEEKPKMVFLRNPPRYPLWKREYRLLF